MKIIFNYALLLVITQFVACSDFNTNSNVSNEDTALLCQDSIDNDQNGYVDCDDQDCLNFVFCVEEREVSSSALDVNSSEGSLSVSQGNSSEGSSSVLHTSSSEQDAMIEDEQQSSGDYSSAVSSVCATIPLKDDEICDPRDGSIYVTVLMDGDLWMAENLNYETQNSWCYNDDDSNCDNFGRLYRWDNVLELNERYLNEAYEVSNANGQGICPKGWGVPTENNWNDMKAFTSRDTSQNSIGDDLVSKTFAGNDLYGFNALLAGSLWVSGGCSSCEEDMYLHKGKITIWWGETNDSTQAVSYQLGGGLSTLVMSEKINGNYLRCIKESGND
ncbi:MAG: hypothetical protein OCD01_14300 [Fibrobacterales bacterium]